MSGRTCLRRTVAVLAATMMWGVVAMAPTGSASATPGPASGTRPVAAVQVSSGVDHTCALLEDATVKCWGLNRNGQLGLGDRDPRGIDPLGLGNALRAVQLGGRRTVTEIVAGGYHSCALLDNGSVKCWGGNKYGQLGLGDRQARGDDPREMGAALRPVDLGAGRRATQITAGSFHTCALLDDRTVKCWGYNGSGVLGLGDSSDRGDRPGEMGDALRPVALGTGRTATRVTAGGFNTCALLDDRSVKCWGWNSDGQLGLGDTSARGDQPFEMGDFLPPIDLGTGRRATRIAVGGHMCAVLDDATVKCWGRNVDGQLGLGDTKARGDQPGEMGDRLRAVSLGRGRTVSRVAVGGNHSCAVLDRGTVKCWGWGLTGALGLGNKATRGDERGEMGDRLRPVDLGSRTAAQVTAADAGTCVLLRTRRVACWGDNRFGQLGLGDNISRGDGPGQMGSALRAVNLGTRRR
jgi:alpha-tubulin suppressor-like RCC1 family protein